MKTMHIQDKKAHVRQSITQRISQMSDTDKTAESRSLCKRVLEILPEAPLVIACYAPLKSEVNILPLIQALIERGDDVYLPVFKDNRITYRQCTTLPDLTPGALNILEPSSGAKELDAHTLQYALIPGRAFDRQGFRLGRGNGGYDIWIQEQRNINPDTQYWGVAFDVQVLNEIPHEAHDEKVDRIVTARGIL
jgi:5-formyltetrahydrofolate cyclo-ligase